MNKNKTKTITKSITKSTNKSLVKKEHKSNVQSLGVAKRFIPSLKVTYKSSKHFEEGKAKLGDFYINEQSLGSTILCTVLAYNYQVMAITKDTKEFKSNLIMPESDTPFPESKEYQKFIEENKACDCTDGLNILVYLTEHNLFGSLFAKKKLLAGGLKMLDLGGNGNIIKVTTIKKEWKNLAWYELSVEDMDNNTGELEEETEKIEIFNAQVIESDDESNDTGRTR